MTDEVEEKTEFKFEELDDRAKEKAREWYREGQTDHDWWHYVYEDAATAARCLGIEIGTNRSQPRNGKSHSTPDISFSGFWSQGDGCCFSGHLFIGDLKEALEKVKAFCSNQDETLVCLAKDAAQIYDDICVQVATDRLLGKVPGDVGYDVEWETVVIVIEAEERYYITRLATADHFSYFSESIETAMDQLVRGFADWIYKQLEAEYDHLTSDESVLEGMEANEYLFDETGSVI